MVNLGDVAISRIHFPVTALGFGRRIGVWLQGCSIRCKGCVVPETWERNAAHTVAIRHVFAATAPWLAEADGVTISGGEPFDQPDALIKLVRGFRQAVDGDILVYSGYPLHVLRARHPDILAELDVLISEPFVQSREDVRAFIGSANQQCTALSTLGRTRYENLAQYARRRDVAISDAGVFMAGVPRRGEIGELAQALTAHGVSAQLTDTQSLLECGAL